MRALVASVLAAALFAACGGKDGDDDTTPDASVVGVPGTYTVSGVVQYEDKPPQEDGSLGAIAPKPARFVSVALIADATGATVQMATSDQAGAYSFTFDAVGGDAMHVLVVASNESPERPITVKNLDDTIHGFGGATFSAGVDTTNDVLVTVASKEAQAFNVFDEIVNEMDRIRTTMGNQAPPPLAVYWEDGSDDGTYYFEGAIHLLGLASDDDGFDDTVILHESGHYVEDRIGRSDSPGGSHDGSPTDPRLAWSEGFSTYWAMAVRGAPIYMDSNADGGWSYDADTSLTKASLQNPISQRVSEDMVTEILWDMGDGAAGDDDMLDGTHDPVLVVQPQYLKTATLRTTGTTGVDLVDMLDGWFMLQGLTSCAAVKSIVVTTHQFPYDFNGPAGACP